MPNWMTESPSFEDHPSWQAVLNHDGSQTTHVLPYDRYNLISIYSIHVAIYMIHQALLKLEINIYGNIKYPLVNIQKAIY